MKANKHQEGMMSENNKDSECQYCDTWLSKEWDYCPCCGGKVESPYILHGEELDRAIASVLKGK